jgi:hypothetical protein
MDRSQMTGALIMGGAVVQILVFLIGVARKSYYTLALPITLAVAAVTGLAFWVGWTMMTTEADVPEPGESEAPA